MAMGRMTKDYMDIRHMTSGSKLIGHMGKMGNGRMANSHTAPWGTWVYAYA